MSLGRGHRVRGWVANLPPVAWVVGGRGWRLEVRLRVLRAPDVSDIAAGIGRRLSRKGDDR